MTTLRVVLDDMVAPGAGRTGRYAERITRALIETAPGGAIVGGVVSASPETDYARIAERLPGLGDLHKSALARRELTAAWQRGIARLPGSGMVHAPSLLAPLSRHDRLHNPGDQTVVTIHDAVPWTNPPRAGKRGARARAMGRRAERHADAVVVPTHAVADALAEHLSFGDRIRVIGAGPDVEPVGAEEAAARGVRLGLPEHYVLAAPDLLDDRAAELLATLAAGLDGVPLVVLAADEGPETDAFRRVAVADPADRAAVFSGAAVVVDADPAAPAAGALLDAFAAGRPVVHTDAPESVELTADAGLTIPAGGDYADRLSAAVRQILGDPAQAATLALTAADRSIGFSWRDAAEKIWQLHADL